MRGIGLGLDCRLPINSLISASTRAEEKGFSAIWALQYFYYRDPFSVLSSIGARTSRLTIGTAVTNAVEKHPLAVAASAASISELTNGRMILGLGTSTPYRLSTEMGIEYSEPLARLQEAVVIIRKFLSGNIVHFEGRFFHVNGPALGWKPAGSHIPIYLAAMGPKGLKTACEIADGVILNYGTPPSYVIHAVNDLRKFRNDLTDFNVTSLIWALPEETEQSLKNAKSTLAAFYSNPGFGETILPFADMPLDLLKAIREYHFLPGNRFDLESAAQVIPDELLRRVMIIGKREAKTRLDQYRRAGIAHPIIVPLGGINQLEKAIDIYSELADWS